MICLATAAALGVTGACAPRHLKLEAEPHEGSVRFLTSLHVNLEEGKRTSWVTVTRTGRFFDRRYGEFEITRAMLLAMVKNFDSRVVQQDVFFDVAHRPDDGAAAKVVKLAVEGDRLRALVEWTDYGIEAVTKRGFTYLSAEYHEDWQDNEKRERHGPVLLGAGLTVRPVVKGLDPIQLSEGEEVPVLIHPELQTKLQEEVRTMWKELIKRLTDNLQAHKSLSEADRTALVAQATSSVEKITDKAVVELVIGAMEAAGKQLAEARSAGQQGAITLQIAAPTGGLTEAQVKELLEKTRLEQEKQVKNLAETQAARRKLLADTINAATGIPEADRKELVSAVEDLVTADTSEDHVKRLAATQVTAGNKLVAARQLAAQGFQIDGSAIITVDSSNAIKELQEHLDKRLGLADMPAEQRYMLSGGAPIAGNKRLVEKALAQFDAMHGRRLADEHKLMKKLAAGDGVVADVAIPVSFERTVLRESLYQLTALALCDVGTAQFAAVVQIPYSYRDTAAAGVAGARVYEGGAIPRAGVKQELEEARPIPQKLAFEVSDEMRYLVGNGQINFDIVADNARNAIRIVGEDTEQLGYNEHLRASDEYTMVQVNNEDLELQADDVKRVFILAQWPVVRPRVIKNLAGGVVATENPIVVNYNAVARSEYIPGGGQPAGIYYVLNYNLGEIYLVNEAGAIQTPANGTAYNISYKYTTNVHKWDMDLGALAVEKKWNDFLYRFGTRKTALEDRQAMPTMATMSGVVRDLIGQSEQFGANFKRTGTDLDAEGNVGRIRDVPTWRSYAPGLFAGDQRIVIGERRTVRFRMLKPWQLGQLQDQKDANGRFTGKKEAYGDQFIVVHTPKLLKQNLTSMVLYSAAARIARANP